MQAESATPRRISRESVVATFPPMSETSNPYQRLLYASLEEIGMRLAPAWKLRSQWLWRQRRDIGVLHFHWLSQYYEHPRAAGRFGRLVLLAQRLLLARALGYRIVWTVHEIQPHDRDGFADRVAPRIVARLAQVLIVHDEATAGKVSLKLRRKAQVVRHGSFAEVYASSRRPPSEVRRELGVPEGTALFVWFGLIRRYKRVEDLLAALELAPTGEGAGFVVLVAGQVIDAELGESLRGAALSERRLRLRLEFVPDEEVHDLLRAADALLLTRSDDGTSGVLILALSLGVPVIVADTPGYRATTADARRTWRFIPESPASLAETLATAASDLARDRAGRVEHDDPLPPWSEVAVRTAPLLRGHA